MANRKFEQEEHNVSNGNEKPPACRKPKRLPRMSHPSRLAFDLSEKRRHSYPCTLPAQEHTPTFSRNKSREGFL